MSIDDIKTQDAQLGKSYDNVYKNALDSFMKEYNALSPTSDKDEIKAREQGKTKTIKAIKEMTDEQRKQAMIRSRKFMPLKKTVIQPVVPPKEKLIVNKLKDQPPLRLQVLQEPVAGFKQKEMKPIQEPEPSEEKATRKEKHKHLTYDSSEEDEPTPSKVKSMVKRLEKKMTPQTKAADKQPSSNPKPKSLHEVFQDIADKLDGRKFEPIDELPPSEELEKMNLKELREIAKKQKVDKYYLLRKPQLLFVLNVPKKLPSSSPKPSSPKQTFKSPRLPSSGGKIKNKRVVGKSLAAVANINA